MLGYYFRLAFKSFRRTPGLTALMAGTIACGIAACIVTMTMYHTMSNNPIWWKNDVLYAVSMDSWNPRQPYHPAHPNIPPGLLTYRDATYLFGSDIPKRKTLVAFMWGVLSGIPGQTSPIAGSTRITTRDFFRMFDVPFEYGGPWSAAADRGPEPVMVISHRENDKLFGGADSVGRTILWNNMRFRIVGVMDHWDPRPRFYDLTAGGGKYGGGAFGRHVGTFVPFQWIETLHQKPSGTYSCWSSPGSAPIGTGRQFMTSNCIWITMWVELPTVASRDRFRNFMNAYWAQQHEMGRFQRPRNNHLWKVSQWLAIHHVVRNGSRILVRLAFAFLGVCLINTVGILLAKFLRGAPLSGIRRALGAGRRQIFAQHMVESALVSLAGSTLGLALGALALKGMHVFYADTHISQTYRAVTQFDPIAALWALALSVLSTFIAGLYPAWRVGKASPAVYLKSQ